MLSLQTNPFKQTLLLYKIKVTTSKTETITLEMEGHNPFTYYLNETGLSLEVFQ